ncbi:MAG TPA: thiamine phosphate synthase [Clostridium sp.]|jgi:thiamine-phosphate pyrophosphorylase|nr:thiamine phosphate synthase [Clostridiales bacterium]HCW03879.1 thiamine phosphate synthase [Clostridium sp.]
MKGNIDYTLYLVTDRELMSTAKLEDAVEQAILGGCTLIQLREKKCSSLEFYDIAKGIKKITDKYELPLIINDRIDIALAVDAAGVHIGQQDLPVAIARKLIGEDKILGVSVSNLEEAVKAYKDGADYLGVGAMFTTNTKSDASLTTMEELKQIRKNVSLPIVVIGGINKATIDKFKGIDIDGFAVVSAIISQPDIRAAAEELITKITGLDDNL